MSEANPITFTRVLADEFAELRRGPADPRGADRPHYFQAAKNEARILEEQLLLEQDPGRRADLIIKQAELRKDLLQTMAKEDVPLSALCISGGGIRSATFALGAIQGLADLGILEHFDYLSTVSGGGFIGSWLSAWKHRKTGLANVLPGLRTPTAFAESAAPDPVQHLREYNNYLSPKLGFFSADTWTLVATVGRNMLLNWLVFIPLLMFGLVLPRIVLSLARLGETYSLWYVPAVRPWLGSLKYVLPAGAVLLFFIGIVNVLRYLPGVGGENHTEKEFLRSCLLPVMLAALAFITLDAWFTGGDASGATSLDFWELLAGILLPGVAAYVVCLFTDMKKLAGRKLRKAALLLAIIVTGFSVAGGAWLLIAKLFHQFDWTIYVTFGVPLLLLAFALAVTVFVGFSSLVLEDDDREWIARAGAWVLLGIVCWTGVFALVLLAPKLLLTYFGPWAKSAFAAVGGVAGCITALAGLSSKTKAQKDSASPPQSGAQTQKTSGILDLAAALAAPVFIIVFLTSLSILTNWILWKTGLVQGNWKDHWTFVENTHAESATLLAIGFLIFSWLMAYWININKFSLHAMYRSRLIRAYPGASNPDSKESAELNKFTGFSKNDNVQMADLLATGKPFHVVNICLNLVSGKRLAWQQRKAESFTISPLHCGSSDLGYRPTKAYGGKLGISLGTAITISGAAASPNMGYHSSPAIGFIMTLFNARLGAWLGNPNQNKWQREGPHSALDSIVREAFGLTDDTSPYVYLSDGGHFENLALYEMIRRQCRYIVVLDSGADPKYSYEDLGNALRKIRIDMKVSIEFEEPFLVPMSKPQYRCAVATLRYPDQQGYVVYVKPVVLGNEPPDVTAYKAANDEFPHQSTADQFFDESQTESYRALGLCSINDIFEHWNDSTGFQSLIDCACDHLGRGPLRPLAARSAASGE